MSAPAQSRRSGSTRFYERHGRRFYSVTTMLDAALRRHALEAWGRNKVAESVIRNPDLVALMIGKCEAPGVCEKVTDLIDLCEKCGATYKWLKESPFASKNRAADIGTHVHAGIDALQTGRPMPPWPVVIKPSMAQWERFVAEMHPTFELSEATVYNASEFYAGTLDAILTIPHAIIDPLLGVAVGWTYDEERDYWRILVDYKTSVRGIYPEIALQLAAYRHAEYIGLPDGTDAPMPAVDGCAGLQLTDEGYRLVPVTADAAIFAAFLHIREAFRFAEVQSKNVLHPEILPAREEVTA